MRRKDSIAIVVDRDFGMKLRPLLNKHRLWVVHSDANRAAVEALWKEIGPERTGVMEVSIASEGMSDDFETMLAGALEHFPELRLIEVVGASPHEVAMTDDAMAERAFIRDRDVPDNLRYCFRTLR